MTNSSLCASAWLCAIGFYCQGFLLYCASMRFFSASHTALLVCMLSTLSCSQTRTAAVTPGDAGTLRAARSAMDAAASSDAEVDSAVRKRVSADAGQSLDAATTSSAADDSPPHAKTDAGAPRSRSDATVATAGDDDAGVNGPTPACTSCGACEEVQEVVSAMHTTMPVSYADPPPSSGPHNPCWASWGIHDTAVPAERWVHNLEHGGIVYLYNCPEACDAERKTLAKLVEQHGHAVLTAYAALPTRFAVVSWGHRLTSECLDEKAFEAFHLRNAEHAPESNTNPPNPMCPP